MASDRVYTSGGAYATDGNYQRTNGVGSRVLRLVTMQLGSWPADPTMGTDWASLTKYDETVGIQAQHVIERGLAPLLKEGAIRDLKVEIDRITDHGLEFTLWYTDASTGDSAAHAMAAAWVS